MDYIFRIIFYNILEKFFHFESYFSKNINPYFPIFEKYVDIFSKNTRIKFGNINYIFEYSKNRQISIFKFRNRQPIFRKFEIKIYNYIIKYILYK